MWQGTVKSIHITAVAGEEISSVEEVRAVAGKGLEGDRYFDTECDRQISVIGAEAIEAMERENGVSLDYGDARRNIVTRGVPLSELVGQEFRVGEVAVRGLRLSEPCERLAQLTNQKDVLRGLAHRAGLKAEILNDGVIRVGDNIQER